MASRAPGLLGSGLDLRLTGATDSKSMILADGDSGFVHAKVDGAIAERVEDWDANAIGGTVSAVDLGAFVDALEAAAARNSGGAAVIVDNTSSEAVANLYAGWLKSRRARRDPQQESQLGRLRSASSPSRPP